MFGDEEEDDYDGRKEFEIDGDSASLLSSRPRNSGVLAFHKGTEEGMFLYLERYKTKLLPNFIDEAAVRPERVVIPPDDCLRLIDKYCYSRHWMMHIGNQKLPFLENSIKKAMEALPSGQRLICLEIGSYCGYSSVAIAKNLRESDILICIECEETCVQWTTRLLQITGLDTRARVFKSSFALPECVSDLLSCLSSLNSGSSDASIGAIFIDHDKRRYLQDLRICEDIKIMRPGCIVIADNVLSFGEPLTEYLDHVRDTDIYSSSELHKSFIEYAVSADKIDSATAFEKGLRDASVSHLDLIDGVEISIYKS